MQQTAYWLLSSQPCFMDKHQSLNAGLRSSSNCTPPDPPSIIFEISISVPFSTRYQKFLIYFENNVKSYLLFVLIVWEKGIPMWWIWGRKFKKWKPWMIFFFLNWNTLYLCDSIVKWWFLNDCSFYARIYFFTYFFLSLPAKEILHPSLYLWWFQEFTCEDVNSGEMFYHETFLSRSFFINIIIFFNFVL